MDLGSKLPEIQATQRLETVVIAAAEGLLCPVPRKTDRCCRHGGVVGHLASINSISAWHKVVSRRIGDKYDIQMHSDVEEAFVVPILSWNG